MTTIASAQSRIAGWLSPEEFRVYPGKVYPWRGVMQSAYSDEFGYLDGNYGYKLEVPPSHPGLIGLTNP